MILPCRVRIHFSVHEHLQWPVKIVSRVLPVQLSESNFLGTWLGLFLYTVLLDSCAILGISIAVWLCVWKGDGWRKELLLRRFFSFGELSEEEKILNRGHLPLLLKKSMVLLEIHIIMSVVLWCHIMDGQRLKGGKFFRVYHGEHKKITGSWLGTGMLLGLLPSS